MEKQRWRTGLPLPKDGLFDDEPHKDILLNEGEGMDNRVCGGQVWETVAMQPHVPPIPIPIPFSSVRLRLSFAVTHSSRTAVAHARSPTFPY